MSKKIGLEDMRQHIKELLAQCEADAGGPDDFHVHRCKRTPQARAIQGGGIVEVHILPVRSAISYATCLHEIGHIKGRYQHSKNFMVVEHWAWQWARAHALVWT